MPRSYTFRTAPGLRKALARIPKELGPEVRDASVRVADRVSGIAASRARSLPGVAKHVAPSIRAKRDRVPVIQMGGSARLPSGGRVGDVIWGAEFGGGRRKTTRQFAPWRGSGDGSGYFLYPTVRDNYDEAMEEYGRAVVAAVDKAARGRR
jgi:hypothetical protein